MKNYTPDERRSFAKARRRERTRSEEMLWRALRAGRLDGFKFKREVPIGPYVVDFSCTAARLVVEIDGRTHDDPDRSRRDAERDVWFESRGFRVLRLSDDLVLAAPEIAVARVRSILRPPSPDPRSREGHPLPEREREELAP
jgi:BirA family biotin operon repressor/biotin-[acetyl-CoA-carboxylase] ligase